MKRVLKVGDKVKYVGTFWRERVGWQGEIVAVDSPGCTTWDTMITVKFSEYGDHIRCFYASLEFVPS